MDVKIEFAGQEKGTIPYESLAAFRLLCREYGFKVEWDAKNQKIQLHPGLSGKIISIAQADNTYPISLRKEKLEWEMLERIQRFLASCGAEVLLQKKPKTQGRADLHLKLSMLEIPSIKKPIMNVSFDSKADNQKWLDLLQHECREAGIQFNSNTDVSEIASHLTVQLKYPKTADSSFWSKFGENSAMMLAMGILARLQGNRTLATLSYLPFHGLPFEGKGLTKDQQVSEMPVQTKKGFSKNQEAAVHKLREEKRREAEVFFDYQVLLDSSNSNKMMIVGNLYIKNTGNEVLLNPVICLRATPAENIRISGQIVPKNTEGVLGITSNQGAKGWKYMNDNWLKEAQEKGETWISPINHFEIPPGKTEVFQNFQISILKPKEQENIKVEGFVFFKEQGLEFAANNRITLSL